MLVALAAIAAKDDAGTSIAAKLQEVSAGGTKCTSFEDCIALLDDRARTSTTTACRGPIEFNETGDPAKATIGIYQYGADNNYTFVEAKSGKI